MPEQVLEHANTPLVEELPGPAPDFSILVDDPALVEPPLRQLERVDGVLTDDAVRVAQQLLEGLNTHGHRQAQPAEADTNQPSTLAERHPDWPDITVEYWPDAHGTAGDFNAAPEKIAKADICIVEAGRQDAAEKARRLQDIADRDPSKEPPTLLEDYMRDNGYLGSALEPVIRSLYGSRKAVGSFDLSSDDFQRNLDLLAAHHQVEPDYSLDGIDATVADFTAKLQDIGRRQRSREKTMATNVEPEIQRILDARPDLKEKPSLRILVPMGKLHTTFRDDLAGGDLGMRVEGDVPTDADFGHRDQIIRKTMRGETEIDRDLQMRAYAEFVIATKFMARLDETGKKELTHTLDFTDYVSGVAAHMNDADIRFLYRNETLDPMTPQRMDRQLSSIGLPPMPYTIDELQTAAASMRAGRTRQ